MNMGIARVVASLMEGSAPGDAPMANLAHEAPHGCVARGRIKIRRKRNHQLIADARVLSLAGREASWSKKATAALREAGMFSTSKCVQALGRVM